MSVEVAISVAMGGVVVYTLHKTMTFWEFIKKAFSLLKSYLSSKQQDEEDLHKNDNDGLFMASDKTNKIDNKYIN